MWLLLGHLVAAACVVGAAAQAGSGEVAAADAAAPIVLDPAQPGPEFDGHGGLSAGGTSRLLIEYPEPQRSELLDYLFLPNFGAAVQVLKLEIGGDTQSTDGTETSHMHFRGDLGCARGYEGWLAKEAKARNPEIKIWSLSWGVPGWIGNVSGSAPTYYCDDNIQYQISWLKCLKDTWGVDSDYLGLWNERPQGSTQYVESLRAALDSKNFGHVGITVEATWEELLRKALTDSKFNASIVAGSAHYPCNATTNSKAALNASKKWWAGEDNTGGLGPDYHDLDRTGNWTGASCWGRKLSQHFIKMGATSTVAWSLIWAGE
jgi:galactosylceramidase